MFHFELLLVFDLYVDDQTIGFKGRHVDKMIISYHNEGIGLQSDALFDQGYTYAFFLRNEAVASKIYIPPPLVLTHLVIKLVNILKVIIEFN